MTPEITVLLTREPVLASALAGILGLLVGSFLNVVIYRLPLMIAQDRQASTHHTDPQSDFNLSWPGSHCPSCGTPVRALDNIPLVSYLLLRGRCRHCQQSIHWQYPVVEVVTALMSAFAVTALPDFHPVWLLFIWLVIPLTVIDLRHQLLPDQLTLTLLWVGLCAAALGWLPVSAADSIGGAIIGYGCLWLLYQLHRRLRGRDGMGYGDFKLLAALGAWLGPLALAPLVFLGALTGLLAAAGLRVTTGRMPEALPFGPFLIAGGIIVVVAGDLLWLLYLGWVTGG